MRYKVTRIGLVNFWLYDDESFDFSDGKLLLRGGNGSGKSVTMQSFIPIILDGNKSSARLDPFGSKDKRIEDYLLGSADSEQKDDSTGYLYMEMKRDNKYLTIGMGLHARKGRPTDFWGFIIRDGKRIGKDLFLYKNNGGKVPLSKKELRFALGNENILVETSKDYKREVNNLLFGFPNLDMYDEFINLLLQLRSPKLSKEYKPTKLMEILSGVLQPLTEEDLRPLSEAIEEMDKTKEKIEKLESDVKQLGYLQKVYNNYNETMLYRKAFSFVSAVDDKKKAETLYDNLVLEINDLEKSLEKNELNFKNLSLEQTRINEQVLNINSSDLESKIKRFNELELEIKEKKIKREKLENDLSNKLDKEKEIQNQLKKIDDDCYSKEKACLEIFDDISSLCSDVKFDEPALVLKDYVKDISVITQFSYLKGRLSKYKNKIEQIKNELSYKKILDDKIDIISNDYEASLKRYQDLNLDIQKVQNKIQNELDDIKDKIRSLNMVNKIVKLSNDEIDKLVSYFKVYLPEGVKESKELYEKISLSYKNSLMDELYLLKNKFSKQKDKVSSIRLSLDELKNKEEEELVFDDNISTTFSYLNDNNIPYALFYKAIEFKDDVSLDVRNKIESTLLASGLLSSIMVSDISSVKGLCGNFIRPTSKKNENLSKYFKARNDAGLEGSLVNEILESISISSLDAVYVSPFGFYVDYFSSFGEADFESKFIGLISRQKAHERKIKEVTDILNAEEAILNNLENLVINKEEEISNINDDVLNFPDCTNLNLLEKECSDLSIKASVFHENCLEQEKKLDELNKELDNLMKKLIMLKENLNFPLVLETFEDVLKDVNDLISLLSEFEIKVNDLYRIRDMMTSKNVQLAEIRETIDELNMNVNDLVLEIKDRNHKKDDIDTLLKSKEYMDISNKLKELDNRSKEISSTLYHLQEVKGQQEQALKIDRDKFDELSLSKREKSLICDIYDRIFNLEYKLGYVFSDEYADSLKCANMVLSKLSSRKNVDVQNIINNYYDAYNSYRLNLNDYYLVNDTIFDDEIMCEGLSEQVCLNLSSFAKRNNLMGTYQGKKIDVFSLSALLSLAIEENNEIISEQDRKLFEEILLKTVGTKIRDRIESSRNWVKKINEIMNDMQKDSALAFGLEWRNKSAEAMDELDTKELVRIFQIDSSIISAKDSEKLINHFRSKLKRLTADSLEYKDTYANIIFEVLDYRNWFEFKMTYKRTNDNKKELTNKVFSTFSGGEKAKTMYIPLFAAVYAKLMGGYDYALKLVALDEAFAGVDEANIREMFGIMESLDLDYILTSQALWGDYETIPSLAIAELVRPNNASAIGVRRYRWNGNVREIVMKEILDDGMGIF